jgi:hypothetical protein
MAQEYLFIAISFYRNIFLSQYLFIAILCAKMSRVNKALVLIDHFKWPSGDILIIRDTFLAYFRPPPPSIIW